jgi:ArsR family metal-binding transcriptional regulator
MGRHDLHSVMKLLPNEDCSLCEAPSCATLARRIVAGKIKPEECPLVDKANLERIKEVLKEGVETSKAPVQEQPFVEIQPCAEYGRVTLEAQLPKPKGSVYDLFDSCTMCTAFSEISDLDGVKCSLELGYGLAQLKEKRIHVFRSGKVTMRRAYDRQDAYATLAMISRSLWPSVICICGCTVQECVSCACPDCRDEVCAGLVWGIRDVPFRTVKLSDAVRAALKRAEGAKAPASSIEAAGIYSKGMKQMMALVEIYKKADKALRAKDSDKIEAIRKTFHESHSELAKLAVQLIVKSQGPDTVLGLVLNGIEANLENIGKGMFSVRNADMDPLYPKALEIVLEATKVISELDVEGAKDLVKLVENLRSVWKAAPYYQGREYVLKMATYGGHLARMLDRPMPDWTLEDEKKAQPQVPKGGERCP